MNNGYFCGGHEVLIDNTIELPMATNSLSWPLITLDDSVAAR
jgi:hypothetical protein